ncbi:MAG: hypothetical protein J6I95_10115 [Anaerotignum sp.]|nr:hypothetical protein [Anaerotignum sp.]
MKKNLNRVLALAMAVCMTATITPVTALAETTEDNTIEITSEVPQDENIRNIEKITVSTVEELKNAITDNKAIVVGNTMDISEDIVITDEVNIDLNAQTNAFASGKGFVVANGGKLTITGSGTITEVEDGKGNLAPVRVFGGGTVDIEGDITLEGWAGIMVRQSGKDGITCDENDDISITVKNATLKGITDGTGANGLYVNGNVDGSNNTIKLNDVTIVSDGDGIYQAGIAATTVTGGSVEGENCGIIVAAGEMTIDSTDVTGGKGSGYEDKGGSTGGAVEVDNTALAVMEHAHVPVKVTVKDGTFEGGAGVTAVGDVEVTLEDGTVDAEEYGMRVLDGAEVTLDGADVTVDNGYGVYVRGLGDDSDMKTVLNVESGSITATGDSYAIAGNGISKNGVGKYGNTEINISGGEITSDGIAVYHPMYGTLNISDDAVITGTTGVYALDGNINISGGVITGTGADNSGATEDNGAAGTGAAVVIETDDAYIGAGNDDTLEPNITGGTFVGAVLSVETKDEADELDPEKEFISGGTFSSSMLNSGLLKSDLTVQLEENSGEAPFSYYESVEDAKNAVTESVGGTITGTENGEEVNETVEPVEPTPDPEPTPSKKKSSSKKYDVEIEKGDIENGTVKVSSTRVKKGATVTITVTPDAGYELDELMVLDDDGDEVKLTEKGNGKFTFTMPRGGVEIEAKFEKADAAAEEPVEKEKGKTELVLTIDQKIVQINGEYVINDVAPVIKGARTMLPIRLIAEAMGAEVAWNAAEQKVTITKDELVIDIFIAQPFATVNGKPVQLDASAFVEQGRTYLPLRFIAENLGAEVVWDAQTQKVTVIGS